MARHLVQLTWLSFAQSFRKRSQVRGSVLGALLLVMLGAAAAVAALLFFEDLPSESARYLRSVLVLVVTVGCFAGSAVTHAADPLDERAAVLAGPPPLKAGWLTLFASFFAPASVVLLPLAIVVAVLSLPGEELGWLVLSAAVLWLSWAVVARLGVRTGQGLNARRWGREFGRYSGYVALLGLMPLLFAIVFLPWREALEVGTTAAAPVLAWVPPASVLHSSQVAEPWVPMLVAVGALVIALLLEGTLSVIAARQAMQQVTAGGMTRLGIFRNATSPARAISARIWLAWARDGRYGVTLTTVIVLPLLLVIPLAIGGLDFQWFAVLPLPLFAFLLGWALHNDTAYDSSGLWLHITSGMRGLVDRAGRASPTLIVGVVIVGVGGAVTYWFTSRGVDAVAAVGVSLALLGTAVGGSSIMSAVRPYPVARPGDSPFAQPVRSWGSALVLHPLAGLVEIALCAPAIWLAFVAIRDGDWDFAWGALGIGAGLGAVFAMVGIFVGGWVFSRRSWQLLDFAQSY